MFFAPSYNPDRDIPDLTGKVVVVTGGNSGLGQAAVSALIKHKPGKVFLTARDLAKGRHVVAQLQKEVPDAPLTLVQLDLADFASVTSAAKEIEAGTDRLDVLMLNGGVSTLPYATTKDGYEIQFGTNHMGHALLTQHLMPLLLRTAKLPETDVRVVSVSSRAQSLFQAKGGIVFDALRTDMADTSGLTLYGQSKLANLLFARHLAREYPGITPVAIHPGTVATRVWYHSPGEGKLYMSAIQLLVRLFAHTPETGAWNQLWASFAPGVRAGDFYDPVGKPGQLGKYTLDDDLAKRLWDWTSDQLKEKCGTSWPAAA